MKEWFMLHWVEILTFLGIGTGGTLGITKAIDRKQNKHITNLYNENEKRKTEIKDLGFKVELNSEMDKSLRRELNEHKDDLNRKFDKIDHNFDRLYDLIKGMK